MGTIRISKLQFVVLLILYTLGTTVLILPSMLAAVSKQDAWISFLFLMVVNIPFVWLYTAWSNRFPDHSGLAPCTVICGKWVGMVVQGAFLFFFVYTSSIVLRDIGIFITGVIMPNTPIQIIHFLFMVPVVYGVKLGLEVIARSAEIVFPYIIVTSLLLSVFIFKQFDLHNLRPVLANGLGQPLKGVYLLIGFPIAELVTFLFVLPFVRGSKAVPIIFICTLTFMCLIGAMFFATTIGILGVERTIYSPFAVYELARSVQIGDFLERIEVLFGMIWFITTFMKLVLYFYAASVTASLTFRISDYRKIVVPLSFVVFPLAALNFRNDAEFQYIGNVIYTVFTMLFGFVLPLLLLMIAKIRGVRGQSPH